MFCSIFVSGETFQFPAITPLATGLSLNHSLCSCQGVAGQRLNLSDEDALYVLSRIVKGDNVAILWHARANSSVAKESIDVARSESIAPTIDHYAVAALEIGFKSGALNGVDGQYQCPKGKEGCRCH